MTENKLRRYRLSLRMLSNILITKINPKVEVINGLPNDAIILRIIQSEHFDRIDLVVASESFDELRDGDIIPKADEILFKEII